MIHSPSDAQSQARRPEPWISQLPAKLTDTFNFICSMHYNYNHS